MNRKYSSISSCLPDWITVSPSNFIILIGENGMLLYSNRTFYESLKISEKEIDGIPFDLLMNNSLKLNYENIFKSCKDFEDGMKNVEFEAVCPDGDWRVQSTWDFNHVKIENQNAIVGMGHRVSGGDLGNHKSFNTNVFKTVDDNALISLTDNTGRILMVNDNFCGYTKFERCELIGRRHQDILCDFHSKSFWRGMLRTIGSGESWRHDIKIESKHGEIFWFHTIINPVFDINGNIVQLMFIQFDVTSHKKIEEEKRDLCNRYEKISANFPGFIYQFVIKPDGSRYFPFMSNGAVDIFKMPTEILKIDASPAFKRVHPEDFEALEASIVESAGSLSAWNHRFRVCHDNGKEIWVQGISTPELYDDGTLMWHGFIYDITEAKQSEERLKKERDKLAEIAFIQAHEFRRPVANMLGIFDILKINATKNKLGPEQMAHWLGLMYTSIKETDEIIAKIVSKTVPDVVNKLI